MNTITKTILFLVFFQASAQKYSSDGIYIPKNLEESFQELDKILPLQFKDSVQLESENDFTAHQHFGLGIWMRNNWELWNNSRLYKYFKKKGIFHPDDMSGIILHSYHRYLNKSEIKLDEQIAYYKAYWDEEKKYPIPSIKDFPDPDLRYNGGIIYVKYTENKKRAILYFIEKADKNLYWIWDYYFGWKKIDKKLRDEMENWLPIETEKLLIELYK